MDNEKRKVDKAKIKIIRIHDFLRSHDSLLANESINIQEAAKG